MHICPTQTGLKLRLLPLTKPKQTEKTMIMGVEAEAGSQSAKQAMKHRVMLMMSAFIRPIMSAARPAKNRPSTDPPFMIARIWKPKELS